MNTSDRNQKQKNKLFIGLVIALLACLWIGWSGYDPYIAQEVVRENIRSSIQGMIQISIQFLLPIAIIVSLAKNAAANRRAR